MALFLAPTDKGLIYAYRASDGCFPLEIQDIRGLVNMILPTDNGALYVSAMDGKLVKLKTQKPIMNLQRLMMG